MRTFIATQMPRPAPPVETVPFNLRIPKTLLAGVDEIIAAETAEQSWRVITRSDVIRRAIEAAVAEHRTRAKASPKPRRR